MNDREPLPLIGLIPAAGKGARFGLPFPKELLPIPSAPGYVPVARSVLSSILAAGATHVVFVVSPAKSQIVEYFGGGRRFGCNLSYVVQESGNTAAVSTSPGLAEALDAAYHLICGKTVLFGMADTILNPPDLFRAALDQFRCPGGCDVLLLLFPAESPKDAGMVDLDEGGSVRAVCDKPRETTLTKMWGGMIWSPTFTEFLHRSVRDGEAADFAQILNDAIAGGLLLRGFEVPGGVFADVGSSAAYARIAQPAERTLAAFSARSGGQAE